MLKVMDKPCNQCLFTENKVVSDSRRSEIIQNTVSSGGFFECHKATIAGSEHCCRNFYDRIGDKSQIVRVAKRLNCVEFSNPVEG
jgi:hypothetical protein